MGRRCSESGNPVQRVMATLGYATKIYVLLVSLYLPSCSVGIDVTWTGTSAVSGIQGQSVNMSWTVNLENYPKGTTFTAVKVIKVPNIEVIRYRSSGEITFYDNYVNRGADLKLTASQSGTLVTVVFTISNLNMTVDQNSYKVIVVNSEDDARTTPDSTMLTVLVPASCSFPQDMLIVNEGMAANLSISITGKPPVNNYIWTHPNGSRLVGNNILRFIALRQDTGTYHCSVYNGIGERANCTRYVNVKYCDIYPSTSIVKVNENDQVSLTCISDGNPEASDFIWTYPNGSSLPGSSTLHYTASRNDVTLYRCSVSNGVGDRGSCSRNVTVQYNKECLSTQKEDSQTPVAVLGALFALSIVLNVVLIASFFWLRRKDLKETSKQRNKEYKGQMNMTLQGTSFNDTDNVAPNTAPEYEPIGRRGLASNSSVIQAYEAVASRTQSPRQPSGVQTDINPLPQYEKVDRQEQEKATISDLSPITYQAVQPHGRNYESLSHLTRLPPKGTLSSPTSSTGEYQSLQLKGLSPHYQALDELNRC